MIRALGARHIVEPSAGILAGSGPARYRQEVPGETILQRMHEHVVNDQCTQQLLALDDLGVARGQFDRGLVLGGSGNGEAIVANRVRGIRCTIGWNVESVRLGRAHNDSNVLSLGERFVAEGDLLAMLDMWLTTPFEGGRHQRRIELIDAGDGA